MKNLIPCLGLALGLSACATPQTLQQQQQLALNSQKVLLTTVDQAATACLQQKLPVCVHNDAAIHTVAATAHTDVLAAQGVINSGADATTILGELTAEVAALQPLLKATN